MSKKRNIPEVPEDLPFDDDVLADPVNRRIWELHFKLKLSVTDTAIQMGYARESIQRRLRKILDAVPMLSLIHI